MRAHDPEHVFRAGPVERHQRTKYLERFSEPAALDQSLCPAQSRPTEIDASMKRLEIYCWNLLELFALDARAPPQLFKSTGVVVRADQTRINLHATIPRTCWCHRRSLVASYSIVIEHHFGMGDSASCQCKAMFNLAVRISLTVAKKSSLWLVHLALPMRVTRSLVLY